MTQSKRVEGRQSEQSFMLCYITVCNTFRLKYKNPSSAEVEERVQIFSVPSWQIIGRISIFFYFHGDTVVKRHCTGTVLRMLVHNVPGARTDGREDALALICVKGVPGQCCKQDITIT